MSAGTSVLIALLCFCSACAMFALFGWLMADYPQAPLPIALSGFVCLLVGMAILIAAFIGLSDL